MKSAFHSWTLALALLIALLLSVCALEGAAAQTERAAEKYSATRTQKAALRGVKKTFRQRNPLLKEPLSGDEVPSRRDRQRQQERRRQLQEEPEIDYVGNNLNQELGLCQGDCDSDDGCEGSLVCFQRDPGDAVPGCSGGEDDDSNSDYCISVATSEPTLFPTTQQPTVSPTPNPRLQIMSNNPDWNGGKLGFCQGFCDTDSDCLDGLVCIEKPADTNQIQNCVLDELLDANLSLIPMPSIATNTTTNLTTIPEEEEDEDEEEEEVGGSFTGTLVVALDGDNTESVSTNTTTAVSRQGVTDSVSAVRFCANPPTPSPTLSPTTATPTTATPTSLPTNRPTPGPTPWPTPGQLAPLRATFVGNPAPDVLQRCQADCDNDGDCAEGLSCYNRGSGESIPGCFFDELSTLTIEDDSDYCVASKPQFRLRLYWEEGYYWQEETKEWFYCMSHGWGRENDLSCWDGNPRRRLHEEEHDYFHRMLKNDNKADDDKVDDTRADDKDNTDDKVDDEKEEEVVEESCDISEWCHYGEEQRPCDPDRIYLDTCSDSDSKQRFEFDYLPSGEIMIRAVSRNKCLKGGRPKLVDCNPNDIDQRWMPGSGSFADFRFEISRVGHETRCLTNHHHPKEREIVEMSECENERNFDTSFWQIY